MAQIGAGIVGRDIVGVITTDDGDTLISTATSADDPDELGFGAALWRYITTGLLNSDFAYGSLGPFGNGPSYWTWTVASGTSVTGALVEDATSGSGRVVDLQLATGAAGDDAYLEQIVKIVSSANRAFSFSPYGFVTASLTSADAEVYVKQQFLTKSLVASGSESSGAFATNAIGAGLEIGLSGTPTRIPPADAYFSRVRYGLRRRSGGATSATSAVTLTETYMITGHPRVMVADLSAPTTYGVGVMRQVGGRLIVDADGDQLAGTTDENAHVALFDRRVLANFGQQTLVAGTTINPIGELAEITAASPITSTAAPTVADGDPDQVLVLVNTGSNAITVQDQGTLPSSNLRLSTATFAIGPRDSLTLVYSSAVGDWIEIGRANVI